MWMAIEVFVCGESTMCWCILHGAQGQRSPYGWSAAVSSKIVAMPPGRDISSWQRTGTSGWFHAGQCCRHPYDPTLCHYLLWSNPHCVWDCSASRFLCTSPLPSPCRSPRRAGQCGVQAHGLGLHRLSATMPIGDALSAPPPNCSGRLNALASVVCKPHGRITH
jgi:hypothetical protein